MKRLLAVFAVAALGWFGLSSARAAPPPPCLDMDQRLSLEPYRASYNGEPAEPRSFGSSLYVTDAGMQFFFAPGELLGVRDADSTVCPRPLREVFITVVDPWTGERFSLSTKATP